MGTFPQRAIIARTNLGLFEEMARVLRGPEGSTKKLGFVGVNSDDFVYVAMREREKAKENVCVCVCVCVSQPCLLYSSMY